MTMEEKKEIAKRIYKELGFETDNFQIERIEEINADVFLSTENQRGIGGVIIGNDGSYHVCGSINPLQYYIDEYKNGVRDNMENKESLKLSNGRYAEDLETKQAFENYMSKVDKYNEQVANGETPDVKMGDLLNEYSDTFYDEALEEKKKKIEEDFNNREKDTKIDDLINQIDEKLESINKEDKIKTAANEIVAKIAELPIGSEFVIGEYFTDYKFEMKENFKLMEEVISLCKSNNIQIENTQDGMILGMPWVYKYKKNN